MIKGNCGVLEEGVPSPINQGILSVEERQKTAKFVSAAFYPNTRLRADYDLKDADESFWDALHFKSD